MDGEKDWGMDLWEKGRAGLVVESTRHGETEASSEKKAVADFEVIFFFSIKV